MHADVDLLVVTTEAVPPLYLECGRQLSPHFFSEARLEEPEDEHTREFLERIAGDVRTVWPRA